MFRKGQAALEFLMTYGWAILAAIVVIGVLAYFGVFSPSTYVPNQCVLAAPLGCNAGVVNTSTVTLEIRNGAGETLDVSSVKVEGCATDSTAVTMEDGDLDTWNIVCDSALSTGKFRGDITVTYQKAGSNLDLTSKGRIVEEVA